MPEYDPLADFAEHADKVVPTYVQDPRERAVIDRVLAGVDRDEWAALLDRHRDELTDFAPTGNAKYADLPFWLAHKMTVASRLDLLDKPPLEILDIGMGGGHFAALAQAMGHRVVGTDIPVPLYDDICRALRVERRIAPVRRQQALPDLGGPFDLVTIIWQTFDFEYIVDGVPNYWSLEDWLFLLADLADNHVKPGGTIYIQRNRLWVREEAYFDPALTEWARARGAAGRENLGEIVFDGVAPGLSYFNVDAPAYPLNPNTLRGKWAKLLARFA